MGDAADIAAMDPALVVTLKSATLQCAGTLSGRTRRHVIEAARLLLDGKPASLTVDMSDVEVADVDGANTFAHLQRMAREAGVTLRWQGLEPGGVRGILPLGLPPLGLSGRSAPRRPAPSSRRAETCQRHPVPLLPLS